MTGQQIRRSQYITTYGPGAILESQAGPRVVLMLDRSDLFGPDHPISDFEIVEQRLSQNLLGGARIVAIPSNAQLRAEENRPIYTTHNFPRWSLCHQHPNHGILYYKRASDTLACPRCPPLGTIGQAWSLAAQQKVRFIQVCPSGHMDDVNWHAVVSSQPGGCSGCRSDYLEWLGSGGALRSVQIRCPACRGQASLGLAYNRSWHCSGARPEEAVRNGPCTDKANIVQRGAANVFVPSIVTALTIPDTALLLHRLLGQRAVLTALSLIAPASVAELTAMLDRLVVLRNISQSLRDTILRHDPRELMQAVEEVMSPIEEQTPEQMRVAEYRRLREAAANGYPRAPGTSSRPQFEVVQSDVRIFASPIGGQVRVTPVSRLRVVMVQTGYSRLDGAPVDRRAYIDGDEWYPGVELFGEGVFIDLVGDDGAPRNLTSAGVHHDRWQASYTAATGGPPPGPFDPARSESHPLFVWWHTFSHRLISALSLSCGYSSAAIRERVFVDTDPTTGQSHGGVLLYTVQPGGDGTLGGLVSLTSRFGEVLARAADNLDACSNDPLCGEEVHTSDRVNGAACYACLFQSETSCEHRNKSLDRNLLLTNLTP